MTKALPLRRFPMAVIAVLAAVLYFAHVTGLRNVLISLPTLVAVGFVIREGRLPAPFRLVLPWLLVCLLSALWSVDPNRSFGDALTSVLLPVGCGLAAYVCLRRADMEGWVAYPMLAGLGAILLVRFVFMAYDTAPPWLASLYAFWPGRGVMSTLAVLSLPMACWLLASGRRLPGAALFVLALVAGAQNWNRMFWLAALATLLPCLFMARLKRWLLVLLLALGIAAAAGGAYWSQKQHIHGQTPAEAAAKDIRWQIWRAWAGVAAERPWLGYGYGIRATGQVGEEKNLPASLDLGRGHPHNILLGQLVQLGAVGLLLFLLALASLARRFGRAFSRPETRAAAMGGMALVVGLLAKNMTDDFFYHSVAALFWVQAGVFLRLAGGDDE